MPAGPGIEWDRDNALGLVGWMRLIDAVKKCKELRVMAGVAPWNQLTEGALVSLDFHGLERVERGLAQAMFVQYLGWSSSCITKLDLRCKDFLFSGNRLELTLLLLSSLSSLPGIHILNLILNFYSHIGLVHTAQGLITGFLA
jgi:hypothetical protein